MKTATHRSSEDEGQSPQPSTPGPSCTRRQFVGGMAVAFAASPWPPGAHGADRSQAEKSAPAGVISPGKFGRYDALGPLLEFLTPADAGSDFATMRGTLPPPAVVPLHSHPDDESFFLISGTLQALNEHHGKFEWFDVPPASFVHVPKNAKHAWRNSGAEPVVQLIITSARLGSFFREACRPLGEHEAPRPPTPADLQRFTRVAQNYGHWLATPEENAAVGLPIGP